MDKNRLVAILFLLFFYVNSIGQVQQTITAETENTRITFSVDKEGKLMQSYFGEKLAGSLLDGFLKTHESYIPFGTNDLFTPAIRMIHSDGNPSLDLKYDSYKVKCMGDVTTIDITLKDPVYPVTVILHMTTYYKENIIKTWTEITHREKKPVILTDFASSMLHFDADNYWLTQFHGDWAKEMRMQESELTSGIKIIDSKLGTRADMYQTPAFFLSLNKPSSETNGSVIAGTLAWSGNFQFLFEVDEKNSLRVISGMNPFASEYSLQPGKSFATPEFIFTYSNHGKGPATRNLHSWARDYGVLNGNGQRLTLLNNWESTQFNFDEKKLSGIFTDAAKLGVDLFLLDDGWFGNKYPRNSDNAGLGDWQANKTKLPDGIEYLVKDAESKGVKFGIWLEPEMVNPKSELYEKHPDWILKLPNRKEDYYRNQLTLDLCNPAVQEFVYNTIDELLAKNKGIAYIKWDCNRMMTNTYSSYLKENQSKIYIEYVRGFYKVLENLRRKYPDLPMMLCSGGGGRTDYGALKYFTEFWPSDNTDAAERVFIQWGYSYFFPALTLSNHITSWGKQSLKYRTDVAMMGRMGYDIDVKKMTDNELLFSQQAVKTYKRLSATIWKGDIYRLIDPYKNDRAVLMYVDSLKNNAVVFAYNLHTRYGQSWLPVKMEGLDANKKYKIKEINIFSGGSAQSPEDGKVFSGDYLMKIGLNVSASQELSSTVLEINAE